VKELVEYIARSLVDNPEAVQVRDLVVQSEEAVAEVPVAVPDLAVEEISVSWIITSTGIRW
jgi:predicted RNA-binding protein YlqC (UPF0109 family)